MVNVRQRIWNLHSTLSDLYQKLDGVLEQHAKGPSEASQSAIVEIREEIRAAEKELEEIKQLEETEVGVGGAKPPGKKPPETAEQPSEEHDERAQKMLEFVHQTLGSSEFSKEELGQAFLRELIGHSTLFEHLPIGEEEPRIGLEHLGVISEELVGGILTSREIDLLKETLASSERIEAERAIALCAFNREVHALLGVLREVLAEGAEPFLESLLISSIRTLAFASSRPMVKRSILHEMRQYAARGNWSAFERKVSVLKAVYNIP